MVWSPHLVGAADDAGVPIVAGDDGRAHPGFRQLPLR
jgi:hypothetical protein